MEIEGKIAGIKYKISFAEELEKIEGTLFDINAAPTACIFHNDKHSLAISKWVSPKRTRSYPFERYNTLAYSRRATVIPIVKDEGEAGDRDFIQWDTVSLMSLLDVFVILAHYDRAEKAGNKITNQKFDERYVAAKLKEIEQYHSSALHWNLKEMKENLPCIVEKAKTAYARIEKETGVKLHSLDALVRFQTKVGKEVSQFISFSREKSKKAQSRELATQQPKERLTTQTKAKMTITNYLGGQYFLTVDEVALSEKMTLIECKHSATALLPSKSDIRDGLLKMILYCNLSDAKANGRSIKHEPILKLTSLKLKGQIHSKSSDKEVANFLSDNRFNQNQKRLMKALFDEARSNNFTVVIEQVK